MFLLGSKHKYLTKSQRIATQERNWEIEKNNLERQNKIYKEYDELTKSNSRKLSASKKALIFLFINCSLIEIFTAWVTVQNIKLAFTMGTQPDFTPLVALIGAVVGEVIGLASYYIKSTKENTEGGIIYESAAAQNFENPPVG